MMFSIGAVIWGSTACDIKQAMMAILPRRYGGESGGNIFAKKGGQRELFCSQGVGLRRNRYRTIGRNKSWCPTLTH